VYRWLWRRLPRGRARPLCAVALAVVAVAVLWFVVFPAVVPHVPLDSTTIAR
jgi:hypothetical protein